MIKGRVKEIGCWSAYKVYLSLARMERRHIDQVYTYDQTTHTMRFNRSKSDRPFKRLQKRTVKHVAFLNRITNSEYCLPF